MRITLLLLVVAVDLYLSFLLLNVRYIDKKESILMLSGEGLIALIGGVTTISVVVNELIFKIKPKKKLPVLIFFIVIVLLAVMYDIGIEYIFNMHGYSECSHFSRKDLNSLFVRNENNCFLERTRWR